MNLNRNRFTQGHSLWVSLILVALLALANNAWAASDTPVAPPATGAIAPDKPPKGAPSEVEKEKPVMPGKYELADSAFKKLDPTGKGYVSKEDIKGLEGFDRVFDEVDSKHTGKLDHSQFMTAWKQYSADKIP